MWTSRLPPGVGHAGPACLWSHPYLGSSPGPGTITSPLFQTLNILPQLPSLVGVYLDGQAEDTVLQQLNVQAQ